MTVDVSSFTQQIVEITSRIPAWQQEAAQTQNLKLAVGQWGDFTAPASRTFVLVHGITANLQWWHTLTQALLNASTSPIRLIACDLRGRGDSDKPSGPYHVASSAADIVGLLDALNISEPINYIGHSLGAHIGTVFASQYPERLRRLILIDGGARLSDDVAASISASLNRLGKIYPNYAEYVAPMKAAGIFPMWNEAIDQAYRYDCHAVVGGVSSKVSKAAIDQEWDNLTAFYEVVDRLYPLIQAPTLLLRAPRPIAEGLEPFLSPEIVKIMTTTIAGGVQVVEVADTNHYTVITQPTTAMLKAILAD
jgi:pimeloyl-ACP methyl ester carboxylesterase